MTNPTLILPESRQQAHKWVDNAPHGTVLTFKKPGRTIAQNDKMWAVLTDVSRQVEHNGRRYTPDMWKALFMHACGHETQFMMGLNGDPFPMGFRSSKLSKQQMSDLLEFIHAWCAEKGVRLTDPEMM